MFINLNKYIFFYKFVNFYKFILHKYMPRGFKFAHGRHGRQMLQRHHVEVRQIVVLSGATVRMPEACTSVRLIHNY